MFQRSITLTLNFCLILILGITLHGQITVGNAQKISDYSDAISGLLDYRFGMDVTGIGYLDGDGIREIAVSTLNENSKLGTVYI